MEAIEKRTGGKWLAVMGMLLLRAQTCGQWAFCLEKRKLTLLPPAEVKPVSRYICFNNYLGSLHVCMHECMKSAMAFLPELPFVLSFVI